MFCPTKHIIFVMNYFVKENILNLVNKDVTFVLVGFVWKFVRIVIVSLVAITNIPYSHFSHWRVTVFETYAVVKNIETTLSLMRKVSQTKKSAN